MLGWEKVRMVTQLASGQRGSYNRNFMRTSICQRRERVKSFITWKYKVNAQDQLQAICETAFKQLWKKRDGQWQMVQKESRKQKDQWNVNQECSQRDEYKGRGLHKTLVLLMFQDLRFPAHSTSTASLKLCMFFGSNSLNITAENDTCVNLANYFFFNFQTKKREESLVFIVVFVFFSVFVKKFLKTCVSFNFSED